MRANHVIAIAVVLVCVGAKLAFFAAPIAEAESRSIESGHGDVFQIYKNLATLPVQKIHDMSFVFPSPAG
jgi:hypothetical protein